MKTKTFLPLLIVLVLVNFLTQAWAMPLSSQEQTVIDNLYNTRDANNLSDLSINLLLAAQTDNLEHYNQIQSEMSVLLETDELTSTQAWMMGRMLAAAQFMNDSDSLERYSTLLEAQAPKENANDPMGVWANGYLLEYYAYNDREKYEDNKDVFLDRANAVIANLSPSDKDRLTIIAWIHVVNLNAVAVAGDLKNYITIKNRLIADTKPSTTYTQPWGMTQALSVVPRTDYPAWIHYWALRAMIANRDYLVMEPLEKAATSILALQDPSKLTPSEKEDSAFVKSIEKDYALGSVNREWIQQEQESNPDPNFLNGFFRSKM